VQDLSYFFDPSLPCCRIDEGAPLVMSHAAREAIPALEVVNESI
jgi:hypothetical protein